jgi:hypothetical protein
MSRRRRPPWHGEHHPKHGKGGKRKPGTHKSRFSPETRRELDEPSLPDTPEASEVDDWGAPRPLRKGPARAWKRRQKRGEQ